MVNMKILIILGPTATGKTDLAIKLAKKLNGEIISADSRQVYKGLDIGTGKMPGGNNGQWKIDNEKLKKNKGYWKVDGIRIWMYDVADPNSQYNVALFVKDATEIIDDIYKRGKLPIVVGGTGLYIKALLQGLPNLSMPIDQELRRELEGLSKEQLQERLQIMDDKKWQSLNSSDKQNPRRLIRAIELSGVKKVNSRVPKFNVLKIGLTGSKDLLFKKVDESVVLRLKKGMTKEAESLYEGGLSLSRMRQLGLEYGVLADYLEKTISTKEELIIKLQQKIHGYVRRQLTWFKKEKEASWYEINDPKLASKVEKNVGKWYHHIDAK